MNKVAKVVLSSLALVTAFGLFGFTIYSSTDAFKDWGTEIIEKGKVRVNNEWKKIDQKNGQVKELGMWLGRNVSHGAVSQNTGSTILRALPTNYYLFTIAGNRNDGTPLVTLPSTTIDISLEMNGSGQPPKLIELYEHGDTFVYTMLIGIDEKVYTQRFGHNGRLELDGIYMDFDYQCSAQGTLKSVTWSVIPEFMVDLETQTYRWNQWDFVDGYQFKEEYRQEFFKNLDSNGHFVSMLIDIPQGGGN